MDNKNSKGFDDFAAITNLAKNSSVNNVNFVLPIYFIKLKIFCNQTCGFTNHHISIIHYNKKHKDKYKLYQLVFYNFYNYAFTTFIFFSLLKNHTHYLYS